MIKYRLYSGFLFLYEGLCSEEQFLEIKDKYSFGQYKIDIIK